MTILPSRGTIRYGQFLRAFVGAIRQHEAEGSAACRWFRILLQASSVLPACVTDWTDRLAFAVAYRWILTEQDRLAIWLAVREIS